MESSTLCSHIMEDSAHDHHDPYMPKNSTPRTTSAEPMLIHNMDMVSLVKFIELATQQVSSEPEAKLQVNRSATSEIDQQVSIEPGAKLEVNESTTSNDDVDVGQHVSIELDTKPQINGSPTSDVGHEASIEPDSKPQINGSVTSNAGHEVLIEPDTKPQIEVLVEPTSKLLINGSVMSDVDVDSMLKHVASIVLVLAGFGLIRSGREPTDVERRLQAEAYGHLGFLIQGLAPKDIVPVEFIQNMIEDLGLKRPKEQQVKTFAQILEEFRAPSIVQSRVEPVQDGTDGAFGMISQMAVDGRAQSRTWTNGRMMNSTVSDATEEMQVDFSKNNSQEVQVSASASVSALGQESSSSHKHEKATGSHQQFTQAIQDMLQSPNPADCQFQPAYPRAFISAPVPCEVCKSIVKDTSSVLACDSCEKIYHLRCIQSYMLKGIPKGDWYCPKCVADGGQEKHKTPKYGRVKAGFSFSKGVAGGQGTSSQGVIRTGIQQNMMASPNIGAGNISRETKTTSSGKKHPANDDIANETKKVCLAPANSVTNGNSAGGFTALLDSVVPTNNQSSSAQLKAGQSQVHNTSKSSVSNPQAQRLSPRKSQQPTQTQSQGVKGRNASKTTGRDGQNNKRQTEHTVNEQSKSADASSDTGQGDPNRAVDDADHISVEWVGDALQKYDGKVLYAACSVGGLVYRLQDCALFRPETPNVPPYIARLQALWEDTNSGSKWVRVNWCYYPTDMAMIAGRPSNPESHEVYESNHGDNNLVGTIQGPCLVLRQESYLKEMERRQELLSSGSTAESLVPVFLCRWTYDAPRATFRPAN